MKILTIFLLFFASGGCFAKSAKIPGTNVDEKALELKISQLTKPSLNFEELEKEVSNFNNYIGSYPPRFSSNKERDSIYKKWLSITSEAEAFAKDNPETEQALYILSELYRQGHNMDVIGSAEKALSNLKHCLTKYEKSIPCNLSASYLYLSIGEGYLGAAEKSLEILRKQFSPKKNAEVEAGYVMLYLFQRNNIKAKIQIDQFISEFPNSERVEHFLKIKESLGNKIELKNS